MRNNPIKNYFIPVILLFLACPSPARPAFSHRLELRLFAGPSMTQIRGDTGYQDEWKLELLSKITEKNRISAKSDNALYWGAFLAYDIRPNYGLEVSLGFLKADVPNTTSFSSELTWTSGANDKIGANWAGSGNIRIIPASFDVFGRSRIGKIEAYGSAGLTLFWNTFQSAAFAGYIMSDITYVLAYVPPKWEKTVIQSVDALPVSLEIGKSSWVAAGLNIGGALDFKLSNRFCLTAGFRYFLCPQREFEWHWQPGTYDGIDAVITGWEFTSDQASYAESKTTAPLKVNPSFFQFGLGVKVFL